MRYKYLLLIPAIIIVFVEDAHAYVDPGSGLMVLQIFAAFVIGGLLTFKNSVSNFLKKFFSKGKDGNKNND